MRRRVWPWQCAMSLIRFNALISLAIFFALWFIYFHYRLENLQSSQYLPQAGADGAGRGYNPRKVIIYNRVPKTGSTTFTNAVAYDLCKKNGFHSIHLNMTKNRYAMNVIDQRSFVDNVTSWTEVIPAFYHGHVAFVDFTKFGYQNPIYVNMVREPLDRLLSHYYFLRYGDNYRIGLRRSRAGNNETFDECIEKKKKDCDMKMMWLQIPYFCGTHSFCSEVGSKQALEEAKYNLLNHYLLVGTTDRLADFIALLEQVLPDFFHGALDHYNSLDENRAHLRYTKKKIPPSAQTLEIVKNNPIYQMEREFFDFAKNQFEEQWSRVAQKDGSFVPKQFHYEKIRPPVE
uniref:Heparan sulfate 2-O-sulfotransferase n=1 Tax=Steinernema glaseri TaxID=37863 RepID=A0A1I7ZSQ4_9BILA